MTAGRPRKPIEAHILSGTFRAHRHGDAGKTPKPLAGIPACPRHLGKVAKTMWRELVKTMGDTGVLTQADRNAMALYCSAYADWREASDELEKNSKVLTDSKTGREYRSPWCSILTEAVTRMRTFGSLLGLDPSARSRLQIEAGAKPAGVSARDRKQGLPPPDEATA